MALSNCTLEDFTGAALTAVHEANPAEYWVGLPVAATGAQVFSVVTGGTYFAIATDPIMGVGLVCTGTPVPSNWNGILVLRQTDPVDGTHDTSFALSVTSAASKPATGIWAYTPTIHWLRRKVILDHIAAERTLFYDPGATYATTLTATSVSQLNTHVNTLAAAADGTSNYKILVQWNGIQTANFLPNHCNFGTGHLLIVADTGYTPCMLTTMTQSRNWSGIIFRNIGICSNSANGISFKLAGSVATGKTYNPRIMWSACKIGNDFWAAEGAPQTASSWSKFILAEFAQEIIIDDECQIAGVAKAIIEGTVRTLLFTPRETRLIAGDILAPSASYNASKPLTFSDNNTYAFVQPRLFEMLDNYSNAANGDPLHKDGLQIRAGVVGTPCTMYVHYENSFVCAGGFSYQKASTAAKYATPTIQAFIDSATTDGCTREVSLFNCIMASEQPRGFWTGPGNLSMAWCSFPASDRKPTASVATTCTPQKHESGGEVHSWNCLLANGGYSGNAPTGFTGGGGQKWHVQGSVIFDFFNTSIPTTQPSAVTKEAVVPYVRAGLDNYWNYPLDYNQTSEAFESDLSRQLHHAAADLASTKGARLRETHVVTPSGGAAVTFTIVP